MASAPPPDENAEQFAGRFMGSLSGALALLTAAIGHRLGLFDAMVEIGEPCTSHELAARAGITERWAREWLLNLASNGFICYRGSDRFDLSPAQRAAFTQPGNPSYMVGFAEALRCVASNLGQTTQAIRQGSGCSYESFGEEFQHALAAVQDPWVLENIVKVMREADGGRIGVMLERGALVGELGCGGGNALVTLARAFPKSTFHGYDNSESALALARQKLTEADPPLRNVILHNPDSGRPEDRLPCDGSFDLIYNHDAIHDMTHPDVVLEAAFKSLRREGGVLVSLEPRAKETLEENITSNPIAPAMSGFSFHVCLNAALSDRDAVGLGALGLPRRKFEAMARKAGFQHCHVEDGDRWNSPINDVFVFRP